MNVNTENSKELIKIMKPIYDSNKVAGYKVNIQNSVFFIHTSNEQLAAGI